MIRHVRITDRRFPLQQGAGSDAVHREPVYAYAVTTLVDESGISGTGLAFTLGAGNEFVCGAAKQYAERLKGKDIETLMQDFGKVTRRLADDQHLRWLGPHKGVVHLALASVTNACFDLWARKRGLPLWKLLTELRPEQVVRLLDLSYLEDILTEEQALDLLRSQLPGSAERAHILKSGYPGYDTSVGWFNFPDGQLRDRCRKAVDAGFKALKLKVGSPDSGRDIRRAHLVREAAGSEVKVMLDANQQWTLPQAARICSDLASMNPYWIEEPTHPDDVFGHSTLARRIHPLRIAVGEHVPNRVLFKNYLQVKGAAFMQPDALRLGGVNEFIAVSLLCRKYDIPVVPHVGDMGQLHQHLVLFNHLVLGHEALFLEYIPHLQDHFLHPARVSDGRYQVPQEPGSSCDLRPDR